MRIFLLVKMQISPPVETLFILRDNILPLFKVLRIDRAYSISFHDFFDLMQNAAEENCGFDSLFIRSLYFNSVMDEEFDDLIPDSVLHYFLSQMTSGLMQLMHDIGCVNPDDFSKSKEIV